MNGAALVLLACEIAVGGELASPTEISGKSFP